MSTAAPAPGTNPRVEWHQQTKGAIRVADRPRDHAATVTSLAARRSTRVEDVGRMVDEAEDWAVAALPALAGLPRAELLPLVAAALNRAGDDVWNRLALLAGVALTDALRVETTTWLHAGGCAAAPDLAAALAAAR